MSGHPVVHVTCIGVQARSSTSAEQRRQQRPLPPGGDGGGAKCRLLNGLALTTPRASVCPLASPLIDQCNVPGRRVWRLSVVTDHFAATQPHHYSTPIRRHILQKRRPTRLFDLLTVGSTFRRQQQQLLIDICCSPAPALSSKPRCCCRSTGQTDRRMDTRPHTMWTA